MNVIRSILIFILIIHNPFDGLVPDQYTILWFQLRNRKYQKVFPPGRKYWIGIGQWNQLY